MSLGLAERWVGAARLAVRLAVRLAARLAAVIAALCLVSGCASEGGSLSYYSQSLAGHLDLMRRARPVADWVADPATPAPLRERLQLALQMRDFAVRELALPDNPSYRRYADLGRSAAVWNVVAAPELSLALKTWCYPLMGCVGYRGYFQRAAAEVESEAQQAAGLEVNIYGVPAYSTLGWTNWLGGDPLLNTFVNGAESALARLIFHELAHQVVYAPGDTDFNESYATAVERLGLARWQATSGQAELLAEMRAEHAALKASATGPWAGFKGYDGWFAQANNASLALQAAYDGLVPGFEQLFEQQGRDFSRFHAEVRRLADLPRAERRATLQSNL